MKLRSACKVTTPEWCLSGPFKKKLFLFSLFIVDLYQNFKHRRPRRLSNVSFIVFCVGFFLHLRQILHVDAGVGGDFFAKLKSVTSVCYINPCRMFPLHPVMSAAPKQNKSSCRNGSPPDFLCLCGAHAEGRGCECRHQSALCMCLHVLSGGRLCV